MQAKAGAPVVAPYESAAQYVEDELRRVDLLIEIAREKRPVNGSPTSFYFNSDDKNTKIDPAPAHKDPASALFADLRLQDERIAARVSRSEARHLPFLRLREMFGLSQLECDLFFICAAPALSPHYGPLYAGLLGHPDAQYATPGLAAFLLAARGYGVARIRSACSAHALLMRDGLLEWGAAPGGTSLLGRPLAADERIVDYLLGDVYIDSAAAGLLFSVATGAHEIAFAEAVLPGSELDRLSSILFATGGPALLYLYGGRGAPFREVAGALCARAGLSLLRLDFARMGADPGGPEPREVVRRALREAWLFQGALLVEGFDRRSGPEFDRLREYFLGEAARLPLTCFLAGGGPDLDGVRADEFYFARIALPVPETPARAAIWDELLGEAGLRPVGIDVEQLAAAFRFHAGQIRRAIARARSAGLLSGIAAASGEVYELPAAALLEGCRAESNRRLGDLTRRVATKFGWGDIVLPPDSLGQLREIEAHVRHAETVYAEWGFEEQILAGRGLNVLFSGPSGTGKTMAASILAGELKLELFKIDLSTVVSKYIGETEKNLSRIFEEAETSNAILFFDEADALFGKRSEVKDAHDRNANIEVGYLLQKMEEYGGVSILATNLRENIDEAFLRRLHSIVEFPFPGPKEREEIWRIAFPANAPRGDDVDFRFLAERVKLAGGGIKNVVLCAAFLAADEQTSISMRHMVLAARREYQKDGRNLMGSDLGRYAGLVEGERE